MSWKGISLMPDSASKVAERIVDDWIRHPLTGQHGQVKVLQLAIFKALREIEQNCLFECGCRKCVNKDWRLSELRRKAQEVKEG